MGKYPNAHCESPGSFFAEFEKREEFNVGELKLELEGLSDESRLLGVNSFGMEVDKYTGGRRC